MYTTAYVQFSKVCGHVRLGGGYRMGIGAERRVEEIEGGGKWRIEDGWKRTSYSMHP